MSTLLIGYDLNRPSQKYEPLIDAIKNLGAWWHHLDSTWLAKTDLTPVEVRNRLVNLIADDGSHVLDDNDELLVVDVTGRARAWREFSDRGSTWLQETY